MVNHFICQVNKHLTILTYPRKLPWNSPSVSFPWQAEADVWLGFPLLGFIKEDGNMLQNNCHEHLEDIQYSPLHFFLNERIKSDGDKLDYKPVKKYVRKHTGSSELDMYLQGEHHKKLNNICQQTTTTNTTFLSNHNLNCSHHDLEWSQHQTIMHFRLKHL